MSGRHSLTPAQAAAIAERLARYVRKKYGSRYRFRHAVGVARTTEHLWNHAESVPDVYHLIRLAEEAGISPTYLLLGKGPPVLVLDSQTNSTSDEFRKAVLQELIGCDAGRPAEIEARLPDLDRPFAWIVERARNVVSGRRYWEWELKAAQGILQDARKTLQELQESEDADAKEQAASTVQALEELVHMVGPACERADQWLVHEFLCTELQIQTEETDQSAA